jgi:hypothetical protein
LGSIMDNQELLTKDSKDVTIQRDGKMWCGYIRNLKRIIFWGCSSFLILTDQKANLLKKKTRLETITIQAFLVFQISFFVRLNKETNRTIYTSWQMLQCETFFLHCETIIF